jgi:hypothetical protein
MCRLDGIRWHGVHTNFQDDRLSSSSNIKVIIYKIGEAAVLVLLMGVIYYELCHWDGLK